MELETIVRNAFPNVPNLPGVPQIPRNVTQVLQYLTPLKSISVSIQAAQPASRTAATAPPTWAIVDSGSKPAIDVDSISDVKSGNDAKVSDHPIERGGFASYNKVGSPNEVKLTVTVSGLARVRALITRVNAMIDSVELFTIVTPYSTYLDFTAVKFDYSHKSGGATNSLDAELTFRNVRIVDPAYSNGPAGKKKTKKPAGAKDANGGKVQPQAATSTLKSAASSISAWFRGR